MIDSSVNRRRFLLGTTAAVGGFCSSSLGSRAAAALSLQQAPPELAAALALASRCVVGDPAHKGIARQLEAALDRQMAARGATITQTAACPFCGCPVTVSRVVS
jgi:hypothetical protein